MRLAFKAAALCVVVAMLLLAAGASWKFEQKHRAAASEPAVTGADSAAAELVDAHIRALQPGHLTDVASTDQNTVKPWFDGRTAFSPPVPDLAAQAFPLVGARLDVFQGRT